MNVFTMNKFQWKDDKILYKIKYKLIKLPTLFKRLKHMNQKSWTLSVRLNTTLEQTKKTRLKPF